MAKAPVTYCIKIVNIQKIFLSAETGRGQSFPGDCNLSEDFPPFPRILPRRFPDLIPLGGVKHLPLNTILIFIPFSQNERKFISTKHHKLIVINHTALRENIFHIVL
jgi:hypothetical protein